jgi:hypothetical protein
MCLTRPTIDDNEEEMFLRELVAFAVNEERRKDDEVGLDGGGLVGEDEPVLEEIFVDALRHLEYVTNSKDKKQQAKRNYEERKIKSIEMAKKTALKHFTMSCIAQQPDKAGSDNL